MLLNAHKGLREYSGLFRMTFHYEKEGRMTQLSAGFGSVEEALEYLSNNYPGAVEVTIFNPNDDLILEMKGEVYKFEEVRLIIAQEKHGKFTTKQLVFPCPEFALEYCMRHKLDHTWAFPINK